MASAGIQVALGPLSSVNMDTGERGQRPRLAGHSVPLVLLLSLDPGSPRKNPFLRYCVSPPAAFSSGHFRQHDAKPPAAAFIIHVQMSPIFRRLLPSLEHQLGDWVYLKEMGSSSFPPHTTSSMAPNLCVSEFYMVGCINPGLHISYQRAS